MSGSAEGTGSFGNVHTDTIQPHGSSVKIKEYGTADLTVKIKSYGLADRKVCIKNPNDLNYPMASTGSISPN